MDAIDFHQAASEEQADQAAAHVRECLEWLNERVKRDYGLEFDVDAMVESDLPDPDEFRPPNGRFYLDRYGDAVAGVGCLGELEDGVWEIRRINAPRQIDRNRRMLRVGLLFLRGLARMNTSMALRCRSSRWKSPSHHVNAPIWPVTARAHDASTAPVQSARYANR